MPRYAPNKMPTAVKKRYFELVRQGMKGAAAARVVGVSTSCGSLWLLDAGGVMINDPGPVSARFLTQDERIEIADGLHAKRDVKVIATLLGRSFQTVYREIQRNSKPNGTYQPWWAHNQALKRRQRPKAVKVVAALELAAEIRAKLDIKWSPQQISRFLTRAHPSQPRLHVCAETIYRALFAGILGKREGRLRTGRTTRKRHRRGVAIPNKIKNMRLIASRPAHVRDRVEPGHWEGDLIIGRNMHSAIGTLVERTTRYTVLLHLPHGYRAPQLRDALVAQVLALPPVLCRSLTWDQGREMAMHESTTAATGLDVYFAEPHSPWQRPTNENTNGLLRQYFPKRSDLSVHTAADLRRVATELNDRPRLVLGDLTPTEAVRRFTPHSFTT
jgi:transposase, IS30 family